MYLSFFLSVSFYRYICLDFLNRAATSSRSSVRNSVSRSNILTQLRPKQRIAQQHPHQLASAAPYRDLNAENKGSKIWTPESRSNILTQQRPQQRIAQQHSHTAASAPPYRALHAEKSRQHPHTAASAACSVSRSNILTQQPPHHRIALYMQKNRGNILTQQRPQQRITQQHPHTAASAAAYRVATPSHCSIRNTVVSRSKCRK